MDALRGTAGVAVGEINPSGTVMVRGEYWNAVSAIRIGPAEAVRVVDSDGLTLRVEPAAQALKTGRKKGDVCRYW